MKARKFFSTLLALLVVLATLLSACAPKATPTPEPTKPPATEEPTQPPMPEPTKAPEPVTLRYANWNVGTEEENNLQRQLVKKYMELNPHVTIEFVDMSGEGSWDDKLTAMAAKGQLPDVFMADKTPLYVKNGWLADLTPLVSADSDWQQVPAVLRNAVTYNGKVLGLPSALFVMGYFVNIDLFEANNLDAPTYGVSVDDFFKATTALTDVQKGRLGLDELEFILGWYPSTQNPKFGWFSFDGVHMNYNSDAFKAAVAKQIEVKAHTWQGLTDEQKANFKSQGPWELFMNQEVGVRWDGGWMVPAFAQNATFNWDFLGIPGGNQAIVGDFLVISKTTANLEEAYKFAKWMSFSREGYKAEAELAKAAGQVPTRMPVYIDKETIDLYLSFVGDKPGLRQALGNLDNSLLESLAKIVPGYVAARWEGKPGIDIGQDKDVNMWYMFNFAADGRYKYEDYSARLEEFANKLLDEARAELKP
ncbi:MAG: extracellular solute-binding protein [Anaerolineales bacterium]|nr:extracellular solute-binding protein [Anaerolineales bacterium]MCX7608397.1 extracellular solute-binding protein [Anaerolineales bacterium]MDW8227472.1 extracellular solute-binding protein [Anaerolineales bacterium]